MTEASLQAASLACAECGREVVRKPSQLKRSRSGKVFCSRSCSWKGVGPAISAAKMGHPVSEETRAKLRLYEPRPRGAAHKSYRGGRPKCPQCGVTINYGANACHKHKIFTAAHKNNQSASLRGKIPKNMQREGAFGNIKRGWFQINGRRMFFRSKWEANYALYLDFLVGRKQISGWEYEPDVFIFEKIKFGTRSYRPDFKITCNDGATHYDEVKGRIDPKSATKLRRMKKYYPAVDIRLIGQKEYRSIKSAVGKMLGFF